MNKGPPKHVYGNKNKLIVRELNSNLVRDRTTNVFRQSAIDKNQDDSANSSMKDDANYKKNFLAPSTSKPNKQKQQTLELGVPHNHNFVKRKKGLSMRTDINESINKQRSNKHQRITSPVDEKTKQINKQLKPDIISWISTAPQEQIASDEEIKIDKLTFTNRLRTTIAETLEDVIQDCPDISEIIACDRGDLMKELRSFYRPESVPEPSDQYLSISNQLKLTTPCHRNSIPHQHNSSHFTCESTSMDRNRFKTPILTKDPSPWMGATTASSSSTFVASRHFKTLPHSRNFLPRSSTGRKNPLYSDEPSLPPLIQHNGSFLSSVASDESESESNWSSAPVVPFYANGNSRVRRNPNL